MPTLHIDLESGSDAADGLSFANRVKTLGRADAIANADPTITLAKLMASTTPNSLGVNATFARGSKTITLAAAQNATIENCETAWTASANVTTTTSTTRKQGSASASIQVNAAFTSGLAAYKSFGATDFSAYQQISFWFQQQTGSFVGFDIKLCSDNAGATPVNTFSVPAAVVANGWNRVTINNGSALGASIQSVGIYFNSDPVTPIFILDNIVACKAPGTGELTHKTLIGKANSLGAGGDDSETWYAIRAIEGTTVTLDLLNSSNAGSTTNGRYWGTSETVTAYSLFPSYVPTSVVSADGLWTAGGTDAATLTISGGWNRTDMTTQTGQTWWALSCVPTTVCLAMNCYASFLAISRLHFIGQTANAVFSINNSAVTGMQFVNSVPFTFQGTNSTFSGIVVCGSAAGNNATINCFVSTIGLKIYTDQHSLQLTSATGCTVTLTNDSIIAIMTQMSQNKLIFNGTTYGSFGEASTAAAVMAAVGDTGVSLAKSIEMFAAFVAGKVSVSSAAGISTYTYKRRDGTTTSFTSLCSETDGTRATTGALS